VLGVAAAMVFAVAVGATPAHAAPNAPKKAPPAAMIPIQVVDLDVTPNGVVATVKIGNQLIPNVPVTLAPSAQEPADPACSILDLTLGPINLNLLGLDVETSKICLSITAIPGQGNLLGNLLCSVAGLLDGGLDLGDILGGLGGLTNAQLGDLTTGLTDLLNGALGAATAPNANTAVGSSQAAPADACDILNLSLGPVDLNLLGLNVHLDDCEDGPVTVDITAIPGPGNLLGNLLCNLAGLLDTPANGNAISNALNRVADAITDLVNAV